MPHAHITAHACFEMFWRASAAKDIDPSVHACQDNTLVLLSSSKTSREVHSAAAILLQRIAVGIKASLCLAAHPLLATSAWSSSIHTDAAATSNAYGSKAVASELAGGSSLNAATGPLPPTDPTFSSSYPPLPRPEAGLNLTSSVMQQLSSQQETDHLNVSSVVHSMLLEVLELLKHPERHFELLPIVEELLPVVTVPMQQISNDGSPAGTDSEMQRLQRPAHHSAGGGGAGEAIQQQKPSPKVRGQLRNRLLVHSAYRGVDAARCLLPCTQALQQVVHAADTHPPLSMWFMWLILFMLLKLSCCSSCSCISVCSRGSSSGYSCYSSCSCCSRYS